MQSFHFVAYLLCRTWTVAPSRNTASTAAAKVIMQMPIITFGLTISPLLVCAAGSV